MDTGFPGGTYSRAFYVADVEAKGAVMNDELHVALEGSRRTGSIIASPPISGRGEPSFSATPRTSTARWAVRE